MNVITPTIGRKVWFWPINEPGMVQLDLSTPMDATVVYPWSDTRVNLAVRDHAGNTHLRPSVCLVQPDTPAPASSHCTWMPFQVGQAKKETGATAGDVNPMGGGDKASSALELGAAAHAAGPTSY